VTVNGLLDSYQRALSGTLPAEPTPAAALPTLTPALSAAARR
jgi:hypothetical protein